VDVYSRVFEAETNTTRQVFCLMSDLHIDASDHDHKLLKNDLEAAKALGARISINGDTFDAIVPSDRKRHHPSVMRNDPERDDIFNQLVKMGVDLLAPYADLIDVISPGNHERSVLKYHHVDVISMLIFGLNLVRSPELPPIHQGSYRGFQRYIWRWKKGRASLNFTIFRHHGVGGSAPVTGGALDLDRIRKDFDADLYWLGHKHNSIDRKFTRISLSSAGRVMVKQQRGVMSAGYKQQLALEDINESGDIADFGETFYRVSEAGAQWLLVEARCSADTTSTGFVDGIRWSVCDSPAQLKGEGLPPSAA